jgi:hypothetical protein
MRFHTLELFCFSLRALFSIICEEKFYKLNLALILIGQFMWAEQIKSYNDVLSRKTQL